MWGLEHFRLYIYGKPIEPLTDHQALEPLIKRNRTNKTYSARLTRWLDRLVHFDINIKHIAGKHLALTDYLSRNPISKPEPIENYDEEYVINCIMPLLEFINNYGSVASQKQLEARTDQNEQREQTINQSEQRRPNKPNPKEDEVNKRSSSLPHLNTVDTNRLNAIQTVQEITMDIRRIEQIEKEDHSEETLNLTKRWKELVKPGEYRTSNGAWKKYNPLIHHRAETKRIEMTLDQRRNRMLSDRMEKQDRETEEEDERRNELHRVIEKIRYTPQKQEKQLETSRETQEQENSTEEETESTSSIESLCVPAIYFKKYMGATGVRYIQKGQASHVQGENEWDLEETIRQAE